MLRLGFCHDQVILSEVIDLYCFVYDFVIFSLTDDYEVKIMDYGCPK